MPATSQSARLAGSEHFIRIIWPSKNRGLIQDTRFLDRYTNTDTDTAIDTDTGMVACGGS